MTKREFYDTLRRRLYDIPDRELGSYIDCYLEMINDRMDEGMTEEEAVWAAGSIDEIAAAIRRQYQADNGSYTETVTGTVRDAGYRRNDSYRHYGYRYNDDTGYNGFFGRLKERFRTRPFSPTIIALIIFLLLFFIPMVLSALGIGLGGVGIVLGLAAAVVGTVIGLYASVVGCFFSAIAMIVTSFVHLAVGQGAYGLFLLGAGFFLGGLSVLLFFAANALTKLIIKGIRKFVDFIRRKLRARRSFL